MNALLKALENKRSVLLIGESGVGKSQTVRTLVSQSVFKSRPFLQLNVTTLNDQLFESELFGHVKGAFTGAHCEREGFASKVSNGVLFLDEIGSLSLSSQAKLLTLLDERIYYRVGSSIKSIFHGHIICATNEDLLKLVNEGKFRRDLFYRISCVQKRLLPLRENINRNVLLKILYKAQADLEISKKITEGLLNEMLLYCWPGNYRELKNCCESMLISSEDKSLKNIDFLNWKLQFSSEEQHEIFTSFKESVNSYERQLISKALRVNFGKINQTSRYLGLNKGTLIAKIKKYDINTELKNYA